MKLSIPGNLGILLVLSAVLTLPVAAANPPAATRTNQPVPKPGATKPTSAKAPVARASLSQNEVVDYAVGGKPAGATANAKTAPPPGDGSTNQWPILGTRAPGGATTKPGTSTQAEGILPYMEQSNVTSSSREKAPTTAPALANPIGVGGSVTMGAKSPTGAAGNGTPK